MDSVPDPSCPSAKRYERETILAREFTENEGTTDDHFRGLAARCDQAAIAVHFAGDALLKQLGASALRFPRLHGVC